MESVLVGLAGECCMVYIDDILIVGKTFEEHLENLRKPRGGSRGALLKTLKSPPFCQVNNRNGNGL